MKAKPSKSGEVVEEFDVKGKDGREHHVMFRYPRMSDLDGLLRFINAEIEEAQFLRLNEKISRKEEGKWLKGTLDRIRKNKKVHLIAVIDGIISGGGGVEIMGGASSHVGELGISLREKYTNIGIGTRLTEALMNESIRIGIEVVKLSHYENNERAKHVYEKLGFIHVGMIPKARKNKDGKYQGEVIMYKILV